MLFRSIADWADLINAHGLCGGTQISALQTCVNPKEQALLLLANMSQESTLFTDDYSNRVVELGQKHDDYVCGFIAPHFKVPNSFLNFSPGVHLKHLGDTQGQRYQHLHIQQLRHTYLPCISLWLLW